MIKEQRVLILRADASPEIGNGHIVRSMALATEWAKKYGKVIFISLEINELFSNKIKKAGFELIVINKVRGTLDDANITKDFVRRYKADWLVLDGSCFNTDYYQIQRSQFCKILVINDIALDVYYDCNILLNQNLHAKVEGYKDQIQKDTMLLLGPKYALLGSDYTSRKVIKHKSVSKNILVTFGGGDTTDATLFALKSLSLISKPTFNITVLLGGGDEEVIKDVTKNYIHDVTIIENNINNMKSTIENHDIALIAGGTTTWEVAHAGVPMVILSIANNQVPNAKELSDRGLAKYAGSLDEISEDLLAKTIKNLALDLTERKKMGSSLVNIIDGYGCHRVLDEMLNQSSH